MPLIKPSFPTWNGGRRYAGCNLFLPLTERNGPTVRDWSGQGNHATVIGAPTFGVGLLGPQVSSFSGSKYLSITTPQFYLTAYPSWAAVLFSYTGTPSTMVALGFGHTTAGQTQAIRLILSPGGANGVRYQVADNAGTTFNLNATTATVNDGILHVFQAVSWAANDHRVYVDGNQVANNTTSIGTFTHNITTVGVIDNAGTFVTPMTTGALSAVAAGVGSVPDPYYMYKDWVSGMFGPIRAHNHYQYLMDLFFFSTGAGPTPRYLTLMGVGS